MKLAIPLLGLFVMGVVMMGAFGLLVELRVGVKPERAIPEVQTTQVPEDAPVRSGAILKKGALESLQRAQTHLARSERSKAVHAIDAAHRTVMVGKSAEPNTGLRNFKLAERGIKRTKHALQMGESDRAQSELARTIATLRMAHGDFASASPPKPEHFEGGTVIRPDGIRVGEFKGVSRSDRNPKAILSLGGYPDFLGFIDIGGETREVPVDKLIFGKDQVLGMSLVVLADSSSDG